MYWFRVAVRGFDTRCAQEGHAAGAALRMRGMAHEHASDDSYQSADDRARGESCVGNTAWRALRSFAAHAPEDGDHGTQSSVAELRICVLQERWRWAARACRVGPSGLAALDVRSDGAGNRCSRRVTGLLLKEQILSSH
jgi:hypothetical protein